MFSLPMIPLNSAAGTSADATVNDFGRVGVSGSSIPSRVRLRVGEPPLTVARRCFGSVITGRVYWGDSDPLLNTSLSVSLPSSLSSGAISSLREIRKHIYTCKIQYSTLQGYVCFSDIPFRKLIWFSRTRNWFNQTHTKQISRCGLSKYTFI